MQTVDDLPGLVFFDVFFSFPRRYFLRSETRGNLRTTRHPAGPFIQRAEVTKAIGGKTEGERARGAEGSAARVNEIRSGRLK